MMIKNVFDSLVATMEHENLAGLDLGKHSSEYYYANEKVLAYQRKIKSALPVELQETLVDLDDEYNCMMTSGMDVYYRQGFSDAVRLIMETMTWSPTRS
ncbi:hypothetical protein SAMN05660742_116110 [Propionispira arboris]|jgi:hypothetical protein|uniref:Uncharacterized protein n=1 Tax=Propionispira arboris TaxID=84035 RepID=A0A1H7BIU8_9FIRM|nr:hypothetical protein [Propionispira arboris]SEJ77519.1 hypothetical protein SAMN05660742_116110 [Propionispira arboris]